MKKIIYNKNYSRFLKKNILAEQYYVVNHYKGCFYGCKYCNGRVPFITSYGKDNWGKIVEVRPALVDKIEKSKKFLKDKKIWLSSLSDPYNEAEKKVGLTRDILKKIKEVEYKKLVIKTRSNLILKDIDLIKSMKNLEIVFSVFTEKDNIMQMLEQQVSEFDDRLDTVVELDAANIDVVLNIFPYLPEITNTNEIINIFNDYIKKIIISRPNWKSNIIKKSIFDFLSIVEPELLIRYHTIYLNKPKAKSELLKKIQNIKNKLKKQIDIFDR